MRFYLFTLLLLLALTPALHAERKNNFAGGIDFLGGASNQIGSGGFGIAQAQKGFSASYSVYPSLNLKSAGQRTVLDLNYAFGADRYQTDPGLTMTSHAGTAGFTAQLGKGTRLRLTDTLVTASDLSTINVLTGFSITQEGFQYVSEPQLYKRSSINNSAAATLETDVGEHSFLTLAASSSIRHYTQDASTPGFNSDQFRTEVGLSFSHRRTSHQTLSARYSVYQNNFQDYPDVRSHSATFGIAQELSPTLRFSMEAGPSFTEKTEAQNAYLGYVASANVTKLVRTNRFSFNYARRTGDSTGLGSSTDSHQGGLGFSRTLRRNLSISLDGSAFTQKQKASGAFDYWGARGALAFSWSLGRHWIMSMGGSYQSYQTQSAGVGNLAYKRVFVSIGYRLPGSERAAR